MSFVRSHMNAIRVELGAGPTDPLLAEMAALDVAEEPTDDQRYVYFVQAVSGGPVKIGVADDPVRRLLSIQTGNPERLRIIGVIPSAGRQVEEDLHFEFRRSRMSGEWFKPTRVLMAFIKRAAVPYEQPAPQSTEPSSHMWALVSPGGKRRGRASAQDVFTLAAVAEATSWPERQLQRDCEAGLYGHARRGEQFGMTRTQIDDLIEAHAVPARTSASTP